MSRQRSREEISAVNQLLKSNEYRLLENTIPRRLEPFSKNERQEIVGKLSLTNKQVSKSQIEQLLTVSTIPDVPLTLKSQIETRRANLRATFPNASHEQIDEFLSGSLEQIPLSPVNPEEEAAEKARLQSIIDSVNNDPISSVHSPLSKSTIIEKITTSKKEKVNHHALRVVVAVLGLSIICAGAALTAHRFQFFNGFLDILKHQLAHPTPTLTAEAREEILTAAPEPNIVTISPTNTPTLEAPSSTPTSGDGPKSKNEFVKYIDATQFDNDSQRTMHTDLYILGGKDGNQTAVIGMPHENSSSALDNFANPKYFLRFNPDKNRWERLALTTDKTIVKISYRNNPGKTADGFSVFYSEGGSDNLSGWEYFDPSDPINTNSELGLWSSTMVNEIKAGEVYYPQDPKRHIPIKSGLAVFSKN